MSRQGARVLVIDDEEDVRELIAELLGAEGYAVATAPDGQLAVEAVRATHFDVATLDLRMPGMSGRETLASLRAVDPGLAVIIASGYVTDEDRQVCGALGACEVVTKPFSVARLLAVVDSALEARRAAIAHRAEPAQPR
jgi:CheY-like chemotaxis protein